MTRLRLGSLWASFEPGQDSGNAREEGAGRGMFPVGKKQRSSKRAESKQE
jgi:hypothetical protein